MQRGIDVKIGPVVRGGRSLNTRSNVLGVMVVEICRAFSGAPSVRDISYHEILWFYDMLRSELRHKTKPREK